MTDIGPGDWVECVNDGDTPNGSAVPLRRGSIYQVERLGVVPAGWMFEGELTVYLFGFSIASPKYFGFAASRFRPIYRPKADLIEGLLKPVLEDA